MADVVELIQHAENHDWPVAGGMLDQTDNFRQTLRCWKYSLAELRSEKS